MVAGSPKAEIPHKISYQGKLTDSANGEPEGGNHSMVFRIYDDPDAGSILWFESQTVSADSAGVFSAILGSITPVDITFDGPVWLEVEVGGEILSPRREIVSVPFALLAEEADSSYHADRAEDAHTVDGFNADAFADTSHEHDDRYYTQDFLNAPGTVNAGANPVDWTKLKGIPSGFADGLDAVGGSGDGHSLDAADGVPVDAVYVDNDGNVGVGTASPSARLHLTGGHAGILVEASSSDPEIRIGGLGDTPSELWRLYKDIGTGELRFMQDEDRLTIAVGTGNMGVGKTLPSEQLDVAGSINLSEHLKFGETVVLSVDGIANTFVGDEAGLNTTAPLGQNNTFVGSVAGFFNTSGFTNVFVGDSTGYGNTTGGGNVFVGSSTGLSNTTGDYNTFVGTRAGRVNDNADANTFIGSSAGFKNEAGSYNTFVGEGAGSFNEGGENNTYIGQGAGNWNNSGSRNTFLGTWAGGGSQGDANVFLGYRAGVNESGSDKLYIANGPDPEDVLIYGDFSSGNVGLGTLNPEWRLHLKGDNPRVLIEAASINPEVNFKHSGDASSDVWSVYKEGISEDLRFYQGGDKIWVKGGSGNVGIGADPGGDKLRVQGSACATGGFSVCSDLRFKEGVEGISDALSTVVRLRGVSFSWKTGEYEDMGFPDGQHFGVIAQEVEDILPEVVTDGLTGEKAVAYAEIIPVLIEAIKAQQVQIEALEARMAEMEK
jgi:hypothetical protein